MNEPVDCSLRRAYSFAAWKKRTEIVQHRPIQSASNPIRSLKFINGILTGRCFERI